MSTQFKKDSGVPATIQSNTAKKSRKRLSQDLYLFVLGYTIGIGAYAIKLVSMGFRGNRFTYIFVIAVITLLLLHRFIAKEVKEKAKRYKSIVIIGLSLGLAYYLFGPNLRAEFGIIDDYQIAEYIGPDNYMSVSEIPQLLMETEVGIPGGFPRYRPSYFVIRLAEALVWGKNPFAWYLARLLMAAACMSILWYLLQNHIGFIPAGLFVTYLFTFPFWVDVFSRLGPAEAYAALGMGIFAMGFNSLLRNRDSDTSGWRGFVYWALITVGVFISIGSKENFLLLILPVLWLLYLAFSSKRWRLVASMSLALILPYFALIVWAVATALRKTGMAIYAQSVSFSSRWEVFLSAIKIVDSRVIIFWGALVGTVLCYAQFIRHDKKLSHIAFVVLKMLVVCYFLFISQFVFYNGKWPIGNRYDFPGALYKPFLYLILVWFLIKALQSIKAPSRVYQGLVVGFIVGLTLVIAPDDLVHIRNKSDQNMRLTQTFATRLDNVTEQMKENPNAAMVIESHARFDYEPIYGWVTYLAASGISNPIFLRLHTYSSATATSDFEKSLTEGLEKTAQEGRRGISPIRQLEDYSDNCFSLQLSGITATECTDLK